MSGRERATVLAALLLLAATPSAGAAGVISGRLVNRTPGGRAVEGVEVTLAREEAAADQTDHEGRRIRTDRQGRFRFEGVPAGAGLRYRLTVRYQGAEYTAAAVSSAEGGAKSLVIPVWDGTADFAKIRVARHHIVVEATGGGVRVQEILVVRNNGTRTFVGDQPVSGDRRATLRFGLPRGYGELQYGEGLMECCVVPTEQGFVDTMDVKPGERQVAFTYQLSPAADRFTLLRRLDYPTEEVDLFIVPAALTVSSESLADRGTISGQGQQYRRWGQSRLNGGALLSVELAGLPGPRFPWKVLAYAAVVALIAGGFAYPFIRRKRRALPAASAPAPSAPASSPPSQWELELRKVELIAVLATLDEQHEAGHIAETDYQRFRNAKKASLAEVMRALEG